jgi:hypothetical protein
LLRRIPFTSSETTDVLRHSIFYISERFIFLTFSTAVFTYKLYEMFHCCGRTALRSSAITLLHFISPKKLVKLTYWDQIKKCGGL